MLKLEAGMRLTLKLVPKNGEIVLPPFYNHFVQGMIYEFLDKALSDFYHNRGFKFGKRKYNLFVFSRLLSKNRRYSERDKTIRFRDAILKISAFDRELIKSLAKHFSEAGECRIGKNFCTIEKISVCELGEIPQSTVTVKMLSPVTVHRTLESEVSKKTVYFSPFDKEFAELIFDNLKRKMAVVLGVDKESVPSLEGSKITPKLVNQKHFVLTRYKNWWIKSWLGYYELKLPKDYLYLAYHTGLGARNSQGFGMFEILK